MFLGWQNQYCENDYTTSKPSTDSMQSLLNYQSFHRTRTTNFTIYIKTQKTPNSLSNLEKEKWSWRNQPFWFQTILQSYSHRDSMVLAAAAAKSLQSCLALCEPIDGSPPGSPIPGILQARTLEWVAISFFNAWKWKVKVKSLSRVQPSATLWTAAFQAPLFMGFSRQEYWSGVPLSSPMVLAQKQKYRPMEQDRKFRDKPTHL